MDGRFKELTARASELMERHAIPGMALGMIINGEDHAEGLGLTSIENPLTVTDSTLFQIGSTTKTITATVIARLIDEGKLHLDDTVRSHLGEFELADPEIAARSPSVIY